MNNIFHAWRRPAIDGGPDSADQGFATAASAGEIRGAKASAMPLNKLPGLAELSMIEAIATRLDPELIEHWRDTGPNWQGRMSAAVRAEPRKR